MPTQKSRSPKKDAYLARITEVLGRHYAPRHPDARIDVRRYNSASVRIRVIDPAFHDLPRTRRDREIWPLLQQHLDEDTLGEISLLLLLAPEEETTSIMNQEFEHPTPSLL